ncbi:MAG TPA: hypothetical protein VIK12_03695 [Pengzhenrongella sp.]
MADPQGLDLREAVDGLTGYAYADLNALWRDLPADPVLAREALNDVLPALVTVYGEAAATLAADWYDDLRESVGPRQRFAAIPAGFADTGAYALVGWATTRAVDATSLRSLVEGGVQRRVANFSRQTVMTSAVKDPAATGWQRIGAGECRSGFCDLLIGRGTVYQTESSATFASHDHCKCGAVPAWGGEPLPVRPYTPSTRVTDADRERTREWFKENRPTP